MVVELDIPGGGQGTSDIKVRIIAQVELGDELIVNENLSYFAVRWKLHAAVILSYSASQ
jgi:hypothetical protein